MAAATHVYYTSSEAPLAVGAVRTLTVELRDDTEEIDGTDNTTVVTFAQIDGDGIVTGLGTAVAVAGVATKAVTGNTAGPVTILATTSTAIISESTAFLVAAPATHLVYTSDVSALPPGVTRTLSVEARDDNDAIDPTYVGNVTFALGGGSVGSLTGLGTVAAVAGVAQLIVTGNALGDLTVTASGVGLAAGDTTAFAVVAPDVAPVPDPDDYTPHAWTPKEAKRPNATLLNRLEQATARAQSTAVDAGSVATAAQQEAADAGESDGLPPSTSPTPTVRGGISYLTVQWAAAANDSPVTYEVHVSTTTNFTPSTITKLGETLGGQFTIRALPDGSDLSYDTTYYVKVVARDTDGSASASDQGSAELVPASTPDIAVDAIVAEHILAGTLTADRLAAVLLLVSAVKTAETGQRVEFDPQGIRLVGSDESVLVDLPTDPNKPASFRGDVIIAGALNVEDNLAIHGVNNTIEPSAVVTLKEGVSDPGSAPTLARAWDVFDLGGVARKCYGLYYDATGGAGGATPCFLRVEDRLDGNWTLCEYVAATGAINRTVTWAKNAGDVVLGVARLSVSVYVLLYDASFGEIRWRIYTRATWSFLAGPVPAVTGLGGPLNYAGGLGADGTNLLVTQNHDSAHGFDLLPSVLRYGNYTAGAVPFVDSTVLSWPTLPGTDGAMKGIVLQGGSWWIMADEGGGILRVRAFDPATGAEVADTSFIYPEAGIGITHDGTNFYTARATTASHQRVTKHSNWTWTDATGAYYWIGYTWRDSVGATETKVSPLSALDMTGYRRAKLSISVPAFPVGANQFRIYTKRTAVGAAAPATTALLRQASTTYIDRENISPASEYDYNAAGAAPPVANNFPNATPGTVTAQAATMTTPWKLLGNGRLILPIVTRVQRDALATVEDGNIVRVSDGIRVQHFGMLGWEPLSLIGRSMRRGHWHSEEFLFTPLNGADQNYTEWVRSADVAPGGTPPTLAAIASESRHPGIHRLATGNGTGAGLSERWPTTGGVFTASGSLYFGALVRVPTLSVLADRFAVIVGLIDGTTAVDPGNTVNGVYFGARDDISANWLTYTAAASVRTRVGSGVAVAAGGWAILEFVVNAAGTSVQFYVNGSLVVTTATNLPASTVLLIPTVSILKALGTNSRTLEVDRVDVWGETSADRA